MRFDIIEDYLAIPEAEFTFFFCMIILVKGFIIPMPAQ